jgi:hypothetical protein
MHRAVEKEDMRVCEVFVSVLSAFLGSFLRALYERDIVSRQFCGHLREQEERRFAKLTQHLPNDRLADPDNFDTCRLKLLESLMSSV